MTMRHRLAMLAGTLLFTAAPPFASAQAPELRSLDEISATLLARYPGTRFDGVRVTPWQGVYEVSMGTNLAYVDAAGRYFLFGHLYDMTQNIDLTAERKAQRARIDVASLPFDDALKEVRGNGSRTLVVFSDPDCPYCRRLEVELKDLTDLTLYTFMMPIPTLHPKARGKAIRVWCAQDPLRAWHALMLRDELADAPPCAHPVDRNMQLGDALGISGTPTLIAADGRVLAGALPRSEIEAWLNKVRAPTSHTHEETTP